MAFQIVDDLLDYTEEAAVTGKPSGSDLREHKVTLPLIAALPRMTDAERRAVERLLYAPEPADAEIAQVIDAVGRRRRAGLRPGAGHQLAEQADAELDQLAPSPARDALRASITYVLDRRR